MNVALVVACAQNRVIGANGAMPWHLPADFAHFKRLTMGHPVVMGRKTWGTLQVQPLPGRRNIVLSRDSDFMLAQAEVAHSVDEVAEMVGDQTCMVIGGAEIYRLFFPLANTIYLTQIEAEIEGDAVFPSYDSDQWQAAEDETRKADDKNPYDLRFMTLRRGIR